MAETRLSRRDVVATAAILPVMAAAFATPVQAQAGVANMRAALAALQEARKQLQLATPGKGGHRAEAIRLVNAAIEQVEQGIAFENS